MDELKRVGMDSLMGDKNGTIRDRANESDDVGVGDSSPEIR